MHGYTLTLLKCRCTLASVHVEYYIICVSFPAGTSTCVIYIQTTNIIHNSPIIAKQPANVVYICCSVHSYIYIQYIIVTNMCTHKFTSMRMAICIYLYICESIFIVVKLSSYIYTYIYIHIHIYIYTIYTHMHINIYTYIHDTSTDTSELDFLSSSLNHPPIWNSAKSLQGFLLCLMFFLKNYQLRYCSHGMGKSFHEIPGWTAYPLENIYITNWKTTILNG